MSYGIEHIPAHVAEHLNQQGISAATAWPAKARPHLDSPMVVVSLRGCRLEPAGFHSYLGEQYNPKTDQWEEQYGRKAELTLGLDLYQPTNLGDERMDEAFQALAHACDQGSLEGISIHSLSCGESRYEQENRLMKREVQATASTWLYSTLTPDGVFTDFHIRGERSK